MASCTFTAGPIMIVNTLEATQKNPSLFSQVSADFHNKAAHKYAESCFKFIHQTHNYTNTTEWITLQSYFYSLYLF